MKQTGWQEYPAYLWQLLSGWRMKHERYYDSLRQRDCAPYVNFQTVSWRVLDLANGRLRPQSMLLAAQGQQVFGIDLVNRPETTWTGRGYRLARWLFSRRLAQRATIASNLRLTCGDVGRLPFAEGSFDLVTSIAAFEHFLEVPRVIAELHRVLRAGGLAWVCIHPFACPSGGHNVSLTQVPLQTLPLGVDAWDHLRRRSLPFHVPLNEWRISQYLDTFSAYFEIKNNYCALREGEHLLTPALAQELSTYSQDELTCQSYVVFAQKPIGN